MVYGGVIIQHQNDDKFSIIKTYQNNGWQVCQPYVYTNNTWHLAGASGVPMIPFYISNGQTFITSDGELFLVRKE